MYPNLPLWNVIKDMSLNGMENAWRIWKLHVFFLRLQNCQFGCQCQIQRQTESSWSAKKVNIARIVCYWMALQKILFKSFARSAQFTPILEKVHWIEKKCIVFWILLVHYLFWQSKLQQMLAYPSVEFKQDKLTYCLSQIFSKLGF